MYSVVSTSDKTHFTFICSYVLPISDGNEVTHVTLINTVRGIKYSVIIDLDTTLNAILFFGIILFLSYKVSVFTGKKPPFVTNAQTVLPPRNRAGQHLLKYSF